MQASEVCGRTKQDGEKSILCQPILRRITNPTLLCLVVEQFILKLKTSNGKFDFIAYYMATWRMRKQGKKVMSEKVNYLASDFEMK